MAHPQQSAPFKKNGSFEKGVGKAGKSEPHWPPQSQGAWSFDHFEMTFQKIFSSYVARAYSVFSSGFYQFLTTTAYIISGACVPGFIERKNRKQFSCVKKSPIFFWKPWLLLLSSFFSHILTEGPWDPSADSAQPSLAPFLPRTCQLPNSAAASLGETCQRRPSCVVYTLDNFHCPDTYYIRHFGLTSG